MSMDNTETKKTKSVFDDDFEVIYEGDLPDFSPEPKNDGYKDVLSQLADLDDDDKNIDYLKENRTRPMRPTDTQKYLSNTKESRAKNHKIPNIFSPIAKTLKTGGKATVKTINLLLRIAAMILIVLIGSLLAANFRRDYLPYGNITTMIADKNYILAAYVATAFLLLLIVGISFLVMLFSNKTKNKGNSRQVDTGRGLFSFILIYLGSWLSFVFGNYIPMSPLPLQGVKGALYVYGSLNNTLLVLCTAGVISCLIRKCLGK